MKVFSTFATVILLSLSTTSAFAEVLCPDGTAAPNGNLSQCSTQPNPIPEPGSFALLAIGAGAGAAAFAWSRRRTKK
jgi:hypothetical protein